MTKTELIDSLVGKPWSNEIEPPEGFTCWSLVQYWYLVQKNKQLPDFVMNEKDLVKVMKAFEAERELEGLKWKRLEKKQEDCIVAMGKHEKITHAGILVFGNYVLHATRESGKVCCEELYIIKQNFKLVGFCLPNF